MEVKEREKIKVLMIGPDRRVHGGISGVVNNYYEAGLDKRIDLCYIGTMVEGSRVRKLWQAAWAFAVFCVKLPGYQIAHINMASDNSYRRKSFFIRAAKLFGKKIVLHQHGGDFESYYYKEQSDNGRKKIDKVLSMGDAFLVLTPVWKEFFSHMVNQKKIIVLPDAIALPEPAPKEYGQHKILFMGRLCKEKGIGELLQIMPELKKQFPGVHLYLGGIWEDGELKAQAGKHKDIITYVGWLTGKEKENYFRQCDIFVMPSYFEGQSVSILEAMAYGCAVAASNTGGIPFMVTDNRTGLLVTPKEAGALKEGLFRLLADKELCRRLGEAARQRAEEGFDIEKNMKKLISVYERVLRSA